MRSSDTTPSKFNKKPQPDFSGVPSVCLGTAECRHVFWFSAGDTVVSLVVGVVMLPGSFVIHRESFYWFCWQSLRGKAGTTSGTFGNPLFEKNLQWQKVLLQIKPYSILDLYFINHKTIYIHFKIEHTFETCYLLKLPATAQCACWGYCMQYSLTSLEVPSLEFYTSVIDILIKSDQQKFIFNRSWKSQLSVKHKNSHRYLNICNVKALNEIWVWACVFSYH